MGPFRGINRIVGQHGIVGQHATRGIIVLVRCATVIAALIVVPRLPLSCTPSPDHSAAVRVAFSPANHDCSYSVGVGQRFAVVAVPVSELQCSRVACYPPALKISDYSIARPEPATYNREEFPFLAIAPGTLEVEPYRITVRVTW
jgi:hypothetical protein